MTPQTNPGSLDAFWADPRMFGMTLLVMFLDTYGTEALEWDPITIQMEVESDFGVDLPAVNYEKLMTAISLLITDGFYSSPPDFTRACVVLSGHQPMPELLLLPDAADVAWGITEAMLISPSDEANENPFSKEITAYIGQVLDSEGILNPPDILRIATRDNSLLDRVNYDYSDDEQMFSAINKMEEGKTGDINFLVKGRARALAYQLESLPLRVGRTAKLTQQLLSRLQGAEDLPLPT